VARVEAFTKVKRNLFLMCSFLFCHSDSTKPKTLVGRARLGGCANAGGRRLQGAWCRSFSCQFFQLLWQLR
jgi:hypothetical protein